MNDLLPKFQSGFRPFHSTETATLKVLSDIYSAIDKQMVTLLALLDVSAAFDTVDHNILLQRLSTSFGIDGKAHSWLQSFTIGRTQTVHVGSTTSARSPIRSGVPQGSVLGPLLYIMYTADIARIVESIGVGVHLYADDIQLYRSAKPHKSADIASQILTAIAAVQSWMTSNRLRLNPDKTQFMWMGSRQQLAKQYHSEVSLIPAASDAVTVLGVHLDPELTFDGHVSAMSRTCFFHLRRIRAIKHCLTPNAVRTLVHAFICSRIDYCNSALYGITKNLQGRLQRILNAAARLITNIPKFGHISAAIRENLHWLPIAERISYKICLIVKNCLAGTAPAYLREHCNLTRSVLGRQNLRSADRRDLIKPGITTEYGRCSFTVMGPDQWNALPSTLRQTSDIQFRRMLKTHLFSRHGERL
jgi:hypothetical protein